MRNVRNFESYSTDPKFIIKDLGESYNVNKMDLEGRMYQFFKENHEVIKGDNDYEIFITYQYDPQTLTNDVDIQNALQFLETLPGVETVIHRMGHKIELTFDKSITIRQHG